MTKRFYYPKNRVRSPDFERALAFTRTRKKTQNIARDYLVTHYSLETLTTEYKTTKQNVFRAVSTLMEDVQTAQATIAKIRRVFNKLNMPNKQYEIARAFFFTSKELSEVAQENNSSVEDVLKIARSIIKLYRLFEKKDLIKEREVEFNEILKYSRAGKKAIQICYDYFVIQDTMIEIAKKHKTTTQNSYNIIKRFEEAQARYKAENPSKNN